MGKTGRPPKWWAGWAPLRQYWQEINRHDRQVEAEKRADRKARDKRRKKCRCAAYPWPHRPGGGLCRHPDPPTERWKPKTAGRPYRRRYTGIVRQIMRANDLHPIRDRAAIESMMPQILALAKQMKRQQPRVKYRNMKITNTGLRGEWQTAGPRM